MSDLIPVGTLPIPPDIIAHYAQGAATAEECRIVEYMLHRHVFVQFRQMLQERSSAEQTLSVVHAGENSMHLVPTNEDVTALYGDNIYEHMAPETLALFVRAEQATIDLILAFGYDTYKDLFETHVAMCARVRDAHLATGGTPPEQIAPHTQHVLEVLAEAIQIRLQGA